MNTKFFIPTALGIALSAVLSACSISATPDEENIAVPDDTPPVFQLAAGEYESNCIEMPLGNKGVFRLISDGTGIEFKERSFTDRDCKNLRVERTLKGTLTLVKDHGDYQSLNFKIPVSDNAWTTRYLLFKKSETQIEISQLRVDLDELRDLPISYTLYQVNPPETPEEGPKVPDEKEPGGETLQSGTYRPTSAQTRYCQALDLVAVKDSQGKLQSVTIKKNHGCAHTQFEINCGTPKLCTNGSVFVSILSPTKISYAAYGLDFEEFEKQN